ncbi:MAG: AAA family ATPase [Cyclobacteriaceae bacterium]
MNEENLFQSRIDLIRVKEQVEKIRMETRKIIVGQHKMIDLLLTALFADGHILIEGVPGVAKTLTAKVFAKIIGSQFSRIQFTPDLMPSDILGTSVFNLKNSDFEFKAGPIFSNIVLIDEVNRAPAKTQAALFEVMEERQVTIDGKTYPMTEPYLVMATQNPIEQEGTYRLPEAQLDRFLFKIDVTYPSLEEEINILEGYQNRKNIAQLNVIQPIISGDEIISLRATINELYMEKKLTRYIAQIVASTREHSDLFLGGSPRATIAIFKSSKAFAAIQGRDFVVPEDIQFVAPPVLSHRVLLTPEKEMEGIATQAVIKQIVEKIEVPR